jgi:predicted metal-dependent peptidase
MSNINESDPVVREIRGARVKLLFDHPFFGQLAVRQDIVDASEWCPTAATDGKRFYYNREFIKKLDKAELLFLIGHEILHVVFDHLGRRGGREPAVWNMANDYIVNDCLKKEKLGKMPEGGLLDADYHQLMSSEEVYALLMKNSVKIKMPLDMHLELGKDAKDGKGDCEGGSASVTVIGKNGPPKLSEDDIERIRTDLKAAVIQAAQQAGAGRTPLGVRRMIDALTQPKLDWRAMLDAHIRSSKRDDYTFQRPSRRSWHLADAYGGPLILPGMNYEDTIDIAVAIDVSGSVTEEMVRDFVSEVRGIMLTFGEFKLKLWTFDTQVYSYKEFDGGNIDEIFEYEVKGGGGTLFECNWEFMKREHIEPQRFVMLTDGYPNSGWGDERYCDTLFIVHGDHSIVAPHGTTAYYDDHRREGA